MTITDLADAFIRAEELDALLTQIYRPLAEPALRYTCIVEPMDLNPSSGTATTPEEAASIALTAYDEA